MPLTETQMKYLALAWQCFESEPKIDYDKFHKIANLASAHSARELMRVTKNKLKSEYGALQADVAAKNTGSKSATSTPKKGGSAAATSRKTATPSSAAGKKRGWKAAAEQADADGDDEEVGSGVITGSEEGGSPTKKKAKKGDVKDNGVKVESGDNSPFGDGMFADTF